MDPERNARRFFIALIVVAGGLVAMVLWPFAQAFLFATVFAATLHPVHERLTRRLRGRRRLSAGLLTISLVTLLLLPIGVLSWILVSETVKGVSFAIEAFQSEGIAGLVGKLPHPLQGWTERAFDALSVDGGHLEAELRRRTSEHGGQLARSLSDFLAAGGAIAVSGTMMLIALFFLLVDGASLLEWIEGNSPVRKGQMRELLAEFRRVSTAVLVSSIVTSGVQAIAALVGYLLMGVPYPYFLALVTFFVAFIPAVGAGGVCVLAALLLLGLGHPWAAGFMVVWGLLVVGLVDNLIKPLLVKRGMDLHGAIVFFSLLGGLAAFGAAGLLLGPLVVTFLVALLRIYARDFRDAR